LASATPRFAADAVIVIGSAVAPDDLGANYHRVGGRAANPTHSKKKRRTRRRFSC
jgi:hypothetical protein